MTLKEVLVYIDRQDSMAARLTVAANLAIRHDARLSGLYVVPQVDIPAYAVARIPQSMLDTQDANWLADAETAQRSFEAVVDNVRCRADWIQKRGFPEKEINLRARYTDLVVLSQDFDQGFGSSAGALGHRVLLESGRPVLFIPDHAAPSSTGGPALLAWNGSREAARAVRDALSLLALAQSVEVVTVRRSEEDPLVPTAALCAHLQRHGIDATDSSLIASDGSIGVSLLGRAEELGADLLVMGGYGHSRAFEAIVGGVTRQVLEHMSIPVLLSH